jgi:UDP-N-acetylmuramate dehydrogenase
VKEEVRNQFCSIIGSDNVYVDEPMKLHTTFRIGGPVDYYLCPHSVEEIQRLIEICKEYGLAYYILGNGSNLLVSDQGYRGVIIQIYKNFNEIVVEDSKITAKAGALLSTIAKKAAKYGLTGFEFASGIPGTLGGAAVMNAGAYGGEMKDVLLEVTVLTDEGRVIVLPREELDLGYRSSVISKKNYIVLEAKIELLYGEAAEIEQRMAQLTEKRTSKQPLEYGSAGSTFKRPEGYFAGKLIMDSGLRGYRVGDAQVSEKHCGFVINRKAASASDVMEVMNHVISTVEEKFNVRLEPEIKMLGEF